MAGKRTLTFQVGATTVDATTALDKLTAKLQQVSVQTGGTGDKFTQLDRNAEQLGKRLGVELSGSTNKSVQAFQTLYDYLVKTGVPAHDIENAFNALSAAQAKYQGGTSFWKEHSGMITAAGSAALAFGVSAVKAFSESEQAGAQLDAVLKSTAGAAGVTRAEADKLADSLSRMSGIDDEAILGAETMLLRFTNIGKDVFPKATEAVLNLSAAMGTDLQSAALMVGKALDSPSQGMTALQRATGKFTEEEVKSITAMAEHGHMAEAQAAILAKLEEKFGGAAKAAGDTFSGSLGKAQVQAENFMESVGSKITPMLQGLIDAFPTASTAVIGFGGAIGNLNVSMGDLLIAVPLLKTAFGLTLGTLAAGAATIGLIAAGITALTATVWAFVAATKAEHEQVAAEYQDKQKVLQATEALTAKAKSYGIEIQKGTKNQYEYNAELFKAIAAYENANKVVEKSVQINKYHKITIDEQIKALKEELAAVVATGRSNEDYNKILNQIESLEKKDTKTKVDLVAAQMAFAEVTRKDAVDAIKKEMEAFKDLDKAAMVYGGTVDETMQRNADLIGQFEDELPDALNEIPPLIIEIDSAYKTLGITSSETLQKQADEARAAYEAIEDSAVASTRDIELAWAAMVEAEIEAAKALGKDVPPEFEKMAKEIEEKWGTVKDTVNKHTKDIGDFWHKQISTVVTDFSKGVADVIFAGGSFKDKMINILKDIGKSIVRYLIEEGLQKVVGWIMGTGGAGAGGGSSGGAGGTSGGIGGALDTLEAKFKSVLSSIGGLFKQFFDWISSGISGIANALGGIGGMLAGGGLLASGLFTGGALGTGLSIGGGALAGFTIGNMIVPGIGGAIGAGIGALAGGIASLFGKDQDKLDDTAVAQAIWPKIWDVALAYQNSVPAATIDLESQTRGIVSQSVGAAWETMKSNFKRPESVTDQGKYLNDVYKLIESVYNTHVAAIRALTQGSTAGTTAPPPATVTRTTDVTTRGDVAKRFAEGGIVTKPTYALIGEAGPEAVVPLNKSAGIVINIGTVVSNDPKAFVRGLIEMTKTNRGGTRTQLKAALT